MKSFDILIAGGGAVGCAVAWVLSRYDIRTALLERSPDVAMGTSGKNSAVVHAGFNNKPGSLMARLCVEGSRGFESLCHALDVPYKKTGKLVVALGGADAAALSALFADGKKNGCAGLSVIDRAGLSALEPRISGEGALYSAETAVFDPFLYTIHLAETALQNGVSFFMNNEVRAVRKERGRFIVTTDKDEYDCEALVNAAGLYADKVAAMAGDDSFTIYPCRGEYFVLDKEAAALISRPVYPAPRKGSGGLGVHLTTTVDGNVLIGPSAEYIESREDDATSAKALDALFEEARRLLPPLERDMVIGSYAGIRAKLVPKGGESFGDFIVEESRTVPALVNLGGIESPGLTASLPIAEMAARIIAQKRPLAQKSSYISEYRRGPVFAGMPPEEQDALIRKDSDYGDVLCRCKTVTRAEALRALRNPLGARTITALKNRTRVTMGRCQGGYCLSKIAALMMEESGCGPRALSLRHYGDAPFPGTVKP